MSNLCHIRLLDALGKLFCKKVNYTIIHVIVTVGIMFNKLNIPGKQV